MTGRMWLVGHLAALVVAAALTLFVNLSYGATFLGGFWLGWLILGWMLRPYIDLTKNE